MKKNSETTVQKTIMASRKTLIFSLACFVLSAAMSFAVQSLQWLWIESIARVLIIFTFLGFGILSLAPAAFFAFGNSELALAWYRALNPVAWPEKSWEQVSIGRRIFLVLWSTFLAIAIITIAVNFDY